MHCFQSRSSCRQFLFALLALSIGVSELPKAKAASLYAPAPCCEMERAGCPRNVSCVAVPTNGPAYVGYYVGGGAWTCWSSRQCADQGTWGWDYRCRCLKPKVVLGWWQRPHEQGGEGSYETDGPRCCPE